MNKILWLLFLIPFLTDATAKTYFSNVSDKPFSTQFFGDTLYLSVSDTARFCFAAGDSLEISAFAEPATQPIIWSPTTGLSISNNGRTVLASPSISTLYTASISTPSGVFSKSVFVISDKLPANFEVSPATKTVCPGDTVRLQTAGFAAADFPEIKFFWSGAGILGEKTNGFALVSPTETTEFSVKITNGSCVLADADDAKIEVISLSIACDPDTNRIEPGDPLILTAVLSPSSLNATNFDFEWFEAGKKVGDGLAFSVETSRNFEDSITLKYRLTGIDQNGCKVSSQKDVILVNPIVKFPNAFTPNGDQNNDTFGMLTLRGNTTLLSLQIFNRWGEIVFESTDPKARWDGQNLNGFDLPSDTYIFLVSWQRKDGALQPIEKGGITLLR